MSDKSTQVTPPRYDGTQSNTQSFAVTNASVAKQIDSRMRMRWVRFRAVGADVSFLLSAAAQSVVVASGDMAPTAKAGWLIPSGQESGDFELGGNDNYINIIGSGTGTLVMVATGSPKGGVETP